MELRLPIGVSLDGQILRDFTLAQVTGKIRIALNDAPAHMPGIDLVALRHIIASLGSVQGAHDHLIRRLTIPDRDYVHALCTARRHGGNIPVRGRCECGEKLEDSVALDNVQVLDASAEVTWVNDKACLSALVELPESGRSVPLVMALPTIASELKVAEARQTKKKSDGEIFADRVAEHVVSLDGRPISSKDLREFPLHDFDAVLAAMDEAKAPRLDGEALVICPSCGVESTLPLLWDEWIVPLARRTGRGS